MDKQKRLTQLSKLKNHLVNIGAITQKEALELYGIGRLAARVWDLRNADEPMNIITNYGYTTTPDGATSRYGIYKMER